MNNTKAYQLMASMGAILRNRFRRFIESPYHNSNDLFLSLFDLIEGSIKEGSTLKKEEVVRHLWPDEAPDDNQLRRFFSQFLKLGLEFISVDTHKSDNVQFSLSLARGVINHKLDPVESSALRNLERALDKSPDRSASWYLHNSAFHKLKYQSEELELKRFTKKTNPIDTIKEVSDHLDLFFIAEKLRFMSITLTWKKLMKTDGQFDFEDEVLKVAKESPYAEYPAISIYYEIYMTEIDPESLEHYYKLRELILENILLFPQIQRKEIVDSWINFSLKRVNQGDTDFLEELFDSYEIGLKLDTLLTKDEMSPWTFRNLVAVGLRLKRFKWVKNFIDTYSEKIPDNYRTAVVSLSKAQYHFYQGQFGSVLDELQKVGSQEFNISINAKITLIATYYELDEYDLLESSINALKVMIRRKGTLNQSRRQLYFNFLKIVETLYKKSLNTKKLRDLRKDIEANRALPSKSWLLEKVDELMGVPTSKNSD